MNYKQCLIINGCKEDLIWLPEDFAQFMKVIKIKNNDVWEDGWVIKAIYGTKDEKYILEHERDYVQLFASTDK